MHVTTVIDEPGRFIEIGEARNVVLQDGQVVAHYCYFGRLNFGDWIDLEPLGNRIPEDW